MVIIFSDQPRKTERSTRKRRDRRNSCPIPDPTSTTVTPNSGLRRRTRLPMAPVSPIGCRVLVSSFVTKDNGAAWDLNFGMAGGHLDLSSN